MSEWVSVNERLPLGVGDGLKYAKVAVMVKGSGKEARSTFERGECSQGPYYSWGDGEREVGVVHYWKLA